MIKLMEECAILYVIGFSMGGMIAAYLAAKYDVEKLVLLAPARKYISVGKIARRIGEVVMDAFRGKLDDNDFYRSEEHTSELQSRGHLVCRLLLEKKKKKRNCKKMKIND